MRPQLTQACSMQVSTVGSGAVKKIGGSGAGDGAGSATLVVHIQLYLYFCSTVYNYIYI